ncbi:hypothetical protein OH77DRAFT_1403931, partial [Trametes cingulata]
GEQFRRCANCEFSLYCSVKCQRDEWATHKAQCKFMRKSAESLEAIRKNGTPEEVAALHKLLKMRSLLVDYSEGHRMSLQYIADAMVYLEGGPEAILDDADPFVLVVPLKWRGDDPKYTTDGSVDPGRAFSVVRGSFIPLSLFLRSNKDETLARAWDASRGLRARYARQAGFGGVLGVFYRVDARLPKLEFYPQCRADVPYSIPRCPVSEQDRVRRNLRFVELGAFYGPNPERRDQDDERYVGGYLKKAGTKWKWWAMPSHRCDDPWHDEHGY